MAETLRIITDPSTPILIVDDNSQFTQVLRRILESGLGYHNITNVQTTQQAFELISAQPDQFKLLFVDYHFPDGTTGGVLLEHLKAAQLLKDKIAFLITSEPTVDNLKQAVAAGAMGVVAKPFDRVELKKMLDKAERSIIIDRSEGF